MPVNHLIQRGTTWHCRLDVPADLRAHYGNRRILSKSLRTGDKILARELASRMTAQWKAEFRAIRDQKLMHGDEWRLAQHTAGLAINASRTAAINSFFTPSAPDSPSDSLPDDSTWASMIIDRYKELRQNGYNVIADKLAAWVKSYSEFCTGDTTKPSPRKPADAIALHQQFLEIIQEAEAVAITEEYLLSKDEHQEALAIVKTPSLYKPRSPISRSAIEAFRKYQEGQTDNARTIAVLISKLEALSAHLSSEGKPLSFDTVADYLDTISDKRQTRQGHLWAMRKFHKWACRYHQPYRDQFAALPSPFAEHTHARVGKAGGESWTPYTPAEVAQLYKAALAKDDQDLADLIMFACYTGCRIEEIGRISTSTTMFENGQPVAFKVEDSKTKDGIRTTPIHPELLPLYQHRLESTQDGYLFAGNKDKAGKRLNAVQQRFTKLKRGQKFTNLHVFHSFRGTVATQLEQAGVGALVIPSIIGHKRGSITFDVYSAGASLKQKADALALLSFDFKT